MAFVSYLDENGNVVNTHMDILQIATQFIKVRSEKNIFRIPWHRVLKTKEAIQ